MRSEQKKSEIGCKEARLLGSDPAMNADAVLPVSLCMGFAPCYELHKIDAWEIAPLHLQ